MEILSLISLEKEGSLEMPTIIYCSRCSETISDYFGDEEYFEYGCKYCFDLPFGSFLKERIK